MYLLTEPTFNELLLSSTKHHNEYNSYENSYINNDVLEDQKQFEEILAFTIHNNSGCLIQNYSYYRHLTVNKYLWQLPFLIYRLTRCKFFKWENPSRWYLTFNVNTNSGSTNVLWRLHPCLEVLRRIKLKVRCTFLLLLLFQLGENYFQVFYNVHTNPFSIGNKSQHCGR